MNTIRLARSLPRSVQLLLVNTLGIALGFYLLVPYLATYLRDELHVATAVVGAVLGLRVFCQQGLTLIGGTAADRFGPRPVIIAGCALRTVAFGMFAFFDDVAGLVVASMLVGFAGALFSPAARAYTAVEAGERRLDAFALSNVASTVGALAGPLIGSVLVAVDFRWTAGVAATVFALLTVWQLFALPARSAEVSAGATLASWREALADRAFVIFAVATSVLFLFYNQFYLLLPLEATRVTGWSAATGGVFLVSTLVTLAAQVRLVKWLAGRVAPGMVIAGGLFLSAAAFVPLGLSAAMVSSADGDGTTAGVLLAAVPVLLATVMLTVSLDVAQPYAQDVTIGFARSGLTGTYLGMAMTGSGIATAAGNAGAGYLDDLGQRASTPWLSAGVLAVLALAAGLTVLRLQRRGRLVGLEARAAEAIETADRSPSKPDRAGAAAIEEAESELDAAATPAGRGRSGS